jgi:aminoglycoside phosphotransferase family enzyme/predicted kinase
LGVLPVSRKNGRLALDGKGTPVDWVVKMRRLPADAALDRRIRSNRMSPQDVDQIARTLSRFFTNLPPITIRPDQYRHRLLDHVRGNRDALLANSELDAGMVRRAHEAQLLALQLAGEMFDHRVLDGRIVEGHGDLRPEHIYLAPSPTIIDCIEFNKELRQLDVLDELCFLAMECDLLDSAATGDEVISQYRRVAGDHFPDRLVAFYKSYRACVRAKVSSLRAGQATGAGQVEAQRTAQDYLRLADTYGAEIGPPVLIIVRGLTGTGKTTLATRLAELLEIERFETDAIRRELFGESRSPAAYGADNYRPENRDRVYDEMLRRARSVLDSGWSAIVDGTFLTTKSRLDALALASGSRAAPLVVECRCPDDVAQERIAARLAEGDSWSESRREIHSHQQHAEEPDPLGLSVCHVDTTLSLPAMEQVVLDRLGRDWRRE